MKRLFSLCALSASLFAADADHSSGNRTTPPTLNAVSPVGVARGTTVEMTVEGLNLAKASAIYFSEKGVTGKILHVKELPDGPDIRLGSAGTPSTIDVGPLPPRNQVTVEVEVSPDAEIGPVGFRLLTPLGTSPEGRFLIEPYYGESPDREPNNTPEDAFEVYLPTILTGTISRPGDVDFFKIHVKDGEQLVFSNGAMLIGSSLQPVVTILAEDQSIVREFGTDGGPTAQRFAHRFEKGGTYYIRIADYLASGKNGHFYRIMVGKFPLVNGAFPLGVQRGKSTGITLSGWNLKKNRIDVKGEPTAKLEDSIELRPEHSFNELKLAVGDAPEIESTGTNGSAARAQAIIVPATINGKIGAPGEAGYYRFHAKKGENVIVEVNARRLGSELDSLVEVLDTEAKPIERATARALSDTFTTLSEKDSTNRGIRLQTGNDFKPGDFAMIGNEIVRVEVLPKGPDEDYLMEQQGGQRIAYFDTTTEAHAIDKPVYRVQVYPPGKKFSSNGLPLVHLYYQNDDGGPGYGKDSLVHFTAPADGDYLVRVRDVRGAGGDDFAYRLTIREPRPDFRLSVANRNPNVPAGGCIPVSANAARLDNFDGPIDVSVQDLPTGIKSKSGTIAAGQNTTTILLCADSGSKLDRAVDFNVVGKAGARVHMANPDDGLKLIALMPQPDVMMTAETKEVVVEQGGEAQITVSAKRQNDFRGRVPVDIRNLPPHVFVSDVGLNGVLINEDETRRSFTIRVLPTAPVIDQYIYVGGSIETRSGLPSTYAAAQPVLLRIKPKP